MVKIVSKGKISKAVNRIKSYGLASMSDISVQQQLRQKYPPRSRDLPPHVTKGICVTSLTGLQDRLKKLAKGVAPGTGGLRSEFLVSLAENLEDHQMELLEDFGMRYQDWGFSRLVL